MLFIYIPSNNPRIQYVFNFIFADYLNIQYRIVSDKTQAIKGNQLISYGKKIEGAKLDFNAHNLLFENDIKEQKVDCFNFNNHVVFFKTATQEGKLPYDPFALCFYMLTRYEEYGNIERDEHGRFPVTESLAFKNDFLQSPIVDLAIHDIAACLKTVFPEMVSASRLPQLEVSYDVDAPFAFRGKGIIKNFLGSFKMMMNGSIRQGLHRLIYTLTGGKDPFDEFYSILSFLEEIDQDAIFFLLLEHEGEHNPAIPYKHYAFDILTDKLARFHEVGIHPSYNCFTTEKIQQEMARFEDLLSISAKKSRSHFIQLQFPNTYRQCLQQGITDDFSMGFPEKCGFRAGIARPFPFYDLGREEETKLTIHPFMVMDATFEYYQKDSSETVIEEEIGLLAKKTLALGGNFHMVFHNDILSGYLSKQDWKYLHEKIIWDIKRELGSETV